MRERDGLNNLHLAPVKGELPNVYLVCAKCKRPWGASGSPAICLACGRASFAIATSGGSPPSVKEFRQDREYRAKMSAALKEVWQNPEYRAKQVAAQKKRRQDSEYRAKVSATRARVSAAIKERWQDPEYRAKQVAAQKKRWQDPELRAKVSAGRRGKHLTAETKAKISAAVKSRNRTKKA